MTVNFPYTPECLSYKETLLKYSHLDVFNPMARVLWRAESYVNLMQSDAPGFRKLKDAYAKADDGKTTENLAASARDWLERLGKFHHVLSTDEQSQTRESLKRFEHEIAMLLPHCTAEAILVDKHFLTFLQPLTELEVGFRAPLFDSRDNVFKGQATIEAYLETFDRLYNDPYCADVLSCLSHDEAKELKKRTLDLQVSSIVAAAYPTN